MSQPMILLSVYILTLVSATAGMIQRPTRARFLLGESGVGLAGIALAFMLRRDLIIALGAGTLFPGVYHAFSCWQRTCPKKAFSAAFLGSMFFLLMTTQRWQCAIVGVVLGFGGTPAALWLTRRTHRTVGLGVLILATAFQVSRVPIMLAGAPLTPWVTKALD